MSWTADQFISRGGTARFQYREPREQPAAPQQVKRMTDLEEAAAHAAEKVADMPDGDAKELTRLAHECGYLGRTLITRNVELRTLRERIREADAREIGRMEDRRH